MNGPIPATLQLPDFPASNADADAIIGSNV